MPPGLSCFLASSGAGKLQSWQQNRELFVEGWSGRKAVEWSWGRPMVLLLGSPELAFSSLVVWEQEKGLVSVKKMGFESLQEKQIFLLEKRLQNAALRFSYGLTNIWALHVDQTHFCPPS